MGKSSNSLYNLFILIVFTIALSCLVPFSQSATTPPISNFDLASTPLDPSTTGFTMIGAGVGGTVGTAGDVDGDGYDDIITSINTIIYGGPTSSLSDIKLDSEKLDLGTKGLTVGGKFKGIVGYEYPVDIARKAGDVNGDGYDDVILGTNIGFSYEYVDEEEVQEGRVYVIFGRERSSEGSSSKIPIPGFMIKGIPRRRDSEFSVNLAGDMNGDGYDDILIGTSSYNKHQGIVYVVYGRPISVNETFIDYGSPSDSYSDEIGDKIDDEGLPKIKIDVSQQVTKLDPTKDGFTITGGAKFDYFGTSVSSAGDVNGDGYNDIIIGATQKNSAQEAAYVVYGGPKSSLQHLDLGSISLDPTTTGFMIKASAVTNQPKIVVNTAGDINGDGYDDILIGTPYKNRYRGIAYVVYGGPKSSLQNIDLNSTTLDPASTGFMITGNIDDQVGFSVSTAGDVNGDGFDDIIIGAPYTNKSQGAAYVIYGGPKSSLQDIDLNSTRLDFSRIGFKITGNNSYDSLGWSVSAAGDINGDGFGDVIVGAPFQNNRQGAAYLIHASCIPNDSSSCNRRELKNLTSGKVCEQGYYQSKARCKRCPKHCSDCSSLGSCGNLQTSSGEEVENIDL